MHAAWPLHPTERTIFELSGSAALGLGDFSLDRSEGPEAEGTWAAVSSILEPLRSDLSASGSHPSKGAGSGRLVVA